MTCSQSSAVMVPFLGLGAPTTPRRT
jgi:hypothetical protein